MFYSDSDSDDERESRRNQTEVHETNQLNIQHLNSGTDEGKKPLSV